MVTAIEVHITAPNSEQAADMARTLVREGLVACVNIVPALRSIYMWKGQLCDEQEVLCLAKTRKELFEPLRRRVLELHPYEVPEVIAFEVEEGSPEYLAWLDTVTTR